ncbi:hypothetical protein HKD37_15G042648 [Glycine soja]
MCRCQAPSQMILLLGQIVTVHCPCITFLLTRHDWIQEIIHGNDNRCYEILRMRKLIVTIYEQVEIFLYMLEQLASVRNTQERLQHFGETIFRQFHRVLKVVLALSKDIIKPIDPTFKDILDQIIKDDRYHPFKNCTNAIDGTHVQIIVPIEHQIPYTCRKGYTSTNVMVVCDFNMMGGSAHDTKVFIDALCTPRLHFPHPPPGVW